MLCRFRFFFCHGENWKSCTGRKTHKKKVTDSLQIPTNSDKASSRSTSQRKKSQIY